MSFEDDSAPASDYDENQLRNLDRVRAVYTAALERTSKSLVDAVVKIAFDPEISPSDRLHAMAMLENRVLGYPVKHIEHTWTRKPLLSDLTEDEEEL